MKGLVFGKGRAATIRNPLELIVNGFRGEVCEFFRHKVTANEKGWYQWNDSGFEDFLRSESVILPGVKAKRPFHSRVHSYLNQYSALVKALRPARIRGRRLYMTGVVGSVPNPIGTPWEFSGGQFYRGGKFIQRYTKEYINHHNNLILNNHNNPGVVPEPQKERRSMYLGKAEIKRSEKGNLYYKMTLKFPFLKQTDLTMFFNDKEGKKPEYPDFSIKYDDVKIGSAWIKKRKDDTTFLSANIASPLFANNEINLYIEKDKEKPKHILHVNWIEYQKKKEDMIEDDEIPKMGGLNNPWVEQSEQTSGSHLAPQPEYIEDDDIPF